MHLQYNDLLRDYELPFYVINAKFNFKLKKKTNENELILMF